MSGRCQTAILCKLHVTLPCLQDLVIDAIVPQAVVHACPALEQLAVEHCSLNTGNNFKQPLQPNFGSHPLQQLSITGFGTRTGNALQQEHFDMLSQLAQLSYLTSLHVCRAGVAIASTSSSMLKCVGLSSLRVLHLDMGMRNLMHSDLLLHC